MANQTEVALAAVKAAKAALAEAQETLRLALVDIATSGGPIPAEVRDMKVAGPLTGPLREWDAFWGTKTVRVIALTADDAKQLAAPRFRVRKWPAISVLPVSD